MKQVNWFIWVSCVGFFFLPCFNFGCLTFQGGKEIAFALCFGIFHVIELRDSII